MIDVHNHILYSLDDGSKTIEESIFLLKKMSDIGFKDVILTPHYIDNTVYSKDNKSKKEVLKKLKLELLKEKIDINIYLGNEIFISDNIIDLINEDKIMPLNNTKYLLIELPLNNKVFNLYEILDNIKNRGYIPIIAHPECNSCFKNNYKLIDYLFNDGVLFQIDYGSIIKINGNKAKKLVKYLIKNRYVSFFGTDIHSVNDLNILDNFIKIKKKIIKYSSIDYFNKVINNGKLLID